MGVFVSFLRAVRAFIVAFFYNPYPALGHTGHMRFSSFFGVGYAKKASGTLASLVALPFGALLHGLGIFFPVFGYTHWLLLLGIVLLFPLGIWSSHASMKATGTDDPSFIVIDEIVGMWIALLFTPFLLHFYLFSFVLFRLFDISKLWLVGLAERTLSPALAVMADDAVAGIFTFTIVGFIAFFFA